MSCPVEGSGGAVCCVAGVATFLVASAITLLVIGILGANGTLPMAPTGAQFCLGLSITMFLGMVSGVFECCCDKK